MISLFETPYKKFPREAGIYKIRTKHNNLEYIGSALSLRKRMKDHRNDLKRGECHVKYMQNVFNIYGEVDFLVEFLITHDKPFVRSSKNHCVLLEEEEYWISKLNPRYNSDKTPTSQMNKVSTSIKVYQYDLEGNFIKEWPSSREVIRQLEIQPGNGLRGGNKSSGGFQWSKEKLDRLPKYTPKQGVRKRFSMYDLFGKKLRTFESIDECAKLFGGAKSTRDSISYYAKSGRVWNSQFRFSLGDLDQLDNTNNSRLVKSFIVIQYSKDEEFIKIWGSIGEAQSSLGITSIYDNLIGKTKTAGGFIWRKL